MQDFFVVTKPQRVDLFLSEMLGESRSQIASLIEKELVFVDGILVKKGGLKLKESQEVKIIFPQVTTQETQDSIDFDVEIIYEDSELLVINKPSSLVVHEAPSVKEKTLVDWLKYKKISLSSISGDERHGIVHRLDKGTSGSMVVAKNNTTHTFLSNQLKDKSMGRYYLCVITPPLKDDIISVVKPIQRSTSNRLKMSCQSGEGREARTDFCVLATSNNLAMQLVACKLYTGRTHQIRVHLESLNRQIVGDNLYGFSSLKSERILLHAYEIYFIHPVTKSRVTFRAKIDDYMSRYIYDNFNKEIVDEIFKNDTTWHCFGSSI